MRHLLLSFALLAGATACNIDPFSLNHSGQTTDGGGDMDGNMTGGDGGHADARVIADAMPGLDACVPVAETCNHLDDNCNGSVDEGFNFQQDPNNCGDCGVKCTYPGGFGACNTGHCEFTGCQPGYVDSDPTMDGCEYQCTPTNGGVEICDHVDNDCDGKIDDGFNVDSDVNNCGTCGNLCQLLHATPKCVDPDGDGLGQCEIDHCDPGFVDVNPLVPGCEYQCTPTNGGVEICDGVDNNCDGTVDDGNPGGGQPCGPSAGVCSPGTTTCTFGVLQCVGAVGGGPEICNNVDDDCDGTVDNGFDKQNDPNHCGGCSPCNVPFATPKCQAGMCGIQACQFGHFNNDGLLSNGCEYACIPTGSEVCDGIDNDCDLGLPGGGVDEGFNLQTDPQNCGSCGNTCSFPHAAALCQTGGCVQGACDANFHDVNPLIPGCEYACTVTNGGVEICDNLDNDCDGVVDDGNPGGGVACGTSTGECSTGTTQCAGGTLQCQGAVGPAAEICDNKDNDCDGTIDDGFNKATDPSHCGTNCTVCAFPHAIPNCTAGMCGIAACQPGFVNANGLTSDGCEYACTPSGPEICDGVDNDCDGKIDAMDPDLPAPPAICATKGACAGTVATCGGASGWVCNYTSPDVEKDMSGNLVLEESRCDGKDNDCDGGIDEIFPLKNSACAEDGTFGTTAKQGVCRGTGSLQCKADKSGLFCSISMAGLAASNETCDGKDNDCDGKTDEPWDFGGFLGVRDDTVTIAAGGALGTYKIYKWEASRPDSGPGTIGNSKARACSAQSRLPWPSATLAEAQSACNAAGMRLCKVTRSTCSGSGASFCCTGGVTADEWGRACEADGGADPTDLDYPYAPGSGLAGYNASTCNGSDFDPIPGGSNEDQAVASGVMASCQSTGIGVFDLSGNLKEWTNDPRCAQDSQGNNIVVDTLRGGSYDNGAGGMTCDFNFTVAAPTFSFPNVGFRCCSANCAAGLSDCSGACVNLGSSNANCGACGNACAVGKTCTNGTCL
jgi:hypothetical protein